MRFFTLLVLSLTFPAVLLAQSGQADDDTALEPLSYSQCLVELDSAVALASNETRRNLAAVRAAGSVAATIDRTSVDAGLAELEARCPPLPQLAHNRAVLAAKAERWPEAVAHLERSLSLDRRAADTHRLLLAIYDYQASLAYAKALDIPVNSALPRLEWQDSTLLNADAEARDSGVHSSAAEDPLSLRQISTLEYELFSWWHALQRGDGAEQFYVDDFPAAAISQSRRSHGRRHWQEMQRDIAFTAQDAVIILTDTALKRTLLLMRLVGTRWKIYQETRL